MKDYGSRPGEGSFLFSLLYVLYRDVFASMRIRTVAISNPRVNGEAVIRDET
jgi:hypothetical protein